ncbi:hypothetical protein EJ04DRAFT_572480 [Polyplosphaeria fusca]|uniref:Uncharacterized protein n=1 Tax=Polyplosphaeria fusca TaxID=682080 RepID=A0A9P4RB13_9PLEO|nr:hypothetical protein EJ04DRAFT_572480 [Polyplosphaeria fusca]
MDTNSEPDTSQELSYPHTPISTSLASLDLPNLIMRSKRLPEEAQSSLDASYFEVLDRGDAVSETSDDDGQTESLASTDIHTPDDVASISSDSTDDEDVDLIPEHPPEYTEYPPPNDPLAEAPMQSTTPEGSMIASNADTQVGMPRYLELEEALTKERTWMEGSAVIRRFDHPQGLPSVLLRYGCTEIQFTLKAGLSPRMLSVSKPYRILYVGVFPSWAEDKITSHITSALQTPSRLLNVLEENASVMVDRCTSVKIKNESGKRSCLDMALASGGTITYRPNNSLQLRGDTSDAQLPDLVVFYQSPAHSLASSSSETGKFLLARQVFERHAVPKLDICLVTPYGDCPSTFRPESNSLRVCVDGLNSSNGSFDTQEILPIDVSTFVNIEPLQLNRHLSLLEHSRQRKIQKPSKYGKKLNLGDFVPKRVKDACFPKIFEQRAMMKLCISLLMLTVVTLVYLTQTKQSSGLIGIDTATQAQTSSAVSMSTTLSEASSVLAVPTLDTPASKMPHSLAAAVRTMPGELTVVHSEESTPSKQHQKPAEEKYSGYELTITGIHEFMLSPSKQFSYRRRKPQLQIQVLRNSEAVAVKISQFRDGAYTVQLEEEVPASLFNVHIVTKPKPLLKQSFEVTLGSSRSTASHWTDSAKHGLAVAQHNLKILSVQVTKGLQTSVTQIETGAALLLDQTTFWIQGSSQSVAEHLQEANRQASRQLSIGANLTKDLSKTLQQNWRVCASKTTGVIHDAVGASVQSLWKSTRPARTSSVVLRARQNALRLRAKLEHAARRSTLRMDKKKQFKGRKEFKNSRLSKGKPKQ